MKFRIPVMDRVAICLFAWMSCYYPLAPADLSFEEVESMRLYDRNGILLREILSPQEGRGQWTSLEKLSPRVVQAAIAAEDKRFYDHGGVDWIALGRAAWQNVSSLAIVSGGSTITQQVIRNVYHYPRNVFLKVLEMWYAIRLEHTLSKKDILEQYCNRIPFGNQTFGVEAAAQLYLGKGSGDLTWSEAAFLMALPKSPTFYNPYRDREASALRKNHILRRLRESRDITADEMERALREPLILFPKSSPFRAPHFVEWMMPKTGQKREVHTSLDVSLQEEVEKIVRGHVDNLHEENVSNAAVLVVYNPTGQILAMTGSSDFFDTTHDGQFNAVFAKRQPGSALKPFTYALAFSRGYTPATVIPDVETIIPTGKGHFTPRNYDNTFHGPVRARMALACSYNVAAVRVVQDIGVSVLLSKLRECGLESLSEDADHYGHGLTLGNGEVTLFELVRAYSLLANDGLLTELTYEKGSDRRILRRNVFRSEVCWMITDILSDAVSRAPAFGYDSPLSLPFRCAVKTGTSSDYRDNWTAGYTTDFTVGVWAGNFDNKPMRGITGMTGAGPIFHDIMMHLYRDRIPETTGMPSGLRRENICSLSGFAANRYCPHRVSEYFLSGSEPLEKCPAHTADGIHTGALSPVYSEWWKDHSQKSKETWPEGSPGRHELRIIYPLNRSRLKIDPSVSPTHQAIYFEALTSPSVHGIRWTLNGQALTGGEARRVYWKLKKGVYRVKVTGEDPQGGLSDEVEFQVE